MSKSIKINTFKVAVALSKDVIPLAQKEITDIIEKLNDNNEFSVNFELFLCNEQNAADSEIDWSDYFYYETPVCLVKKINETHKPDLIITVFWKFFGSRQSASENLDLLTKSWIGSDDFFNTKILFCKENPSNLSEDEKSNRQFISNFRREVNKDHFNAGVLGECKKSKIAEEIKQILSNLLTSRFGSKSQMTSREYKSSSTLQLNLPDGWLYLNKWLNDNSHLIGRQLSKEDADNFFNGKIPTFDEVISGTIPPRTINLELREFIVKAANAKKFAVTLIHGAGGEGKTTILKQVASDLLLHSDLKIHVISREGSANVKDLISILESKKESFVIVSDNAQEIIQDILELAQKDSKPNNIQFFLASRTTHWQWEKNADSTLNRNLGSYFQKREIGTLNEKDAEEIIKAWEKTNVLGELKDETNRVKRLLEESRLRSDRSGKRNSFFSSILWVRKHQTLDNRVFDIYTQLENRSSFNGKTLAKYYDYIISLHGDGIPILTDLVLREALGCDENTLKNEILDPLKGETAILQEGALILARHDVFAERAKFVRKKPVFDDEGNFLYFDIPDYFNSIIGELAVAAEKLQKGGKLGEIENAKWLALKDEYFTKLNQPEVALAIVKATSEALIFEPVLVTRWAKLLRVWGENLRKEANKLKRQSRYADAQNYYNKSKEKLFEAARVFLNCYDKTLPQRSYFTEWGVIQGEIGNSFFSAWLTSISLTDELKEKRHLAKPSMLELASLATAFSKSFIKSNGNNFNSSVFKKATEGVFKLAFHEMAKKNIDFPEMNEFKKFNIDDTERNLRTAFGKVSGNDVSKISLEDAFQFMLDGINLAWELCEVEKETLSASLPTAPDLKFNKLKKMFGITAKGKDATHGQPQNIPQKTNYKEEKFPFVCDIDSLEIFDAEGYKPDLSEDLLNVLKSFFFKDGEGIKSKLTFSEVAAVYKRQEIYDTEKAKEEANNFARNLRRQLEEKYGVDDKDEIIKSWFGKGFQIGKNLITKSKYKNQDAVADRPNKLYRKD
ncbi:MAG: hypothetical protein LUM44_07270 [Pyrinomonadaceae bacterium]|nr:hypothetical protein [Pyrinomonadaceae bacterium]